ncbi:MAG: DinB family protein [Flavitalea sp.]
MTNIFIQTKSLTPQERDSAVQLLQQTEKQVLESVKNLTERQLKFNPAKDKWSVEECIKHIASAERTLWVMIEQSLKQTENPAERAGIKFTDQQLVNAVKDRSNKSKTFAALEPSNASYKTSDEALRSFKTDRKKLIGFVNSTNADLRNHVSVLSIGTYDAYQFILLIAAHSDRHTQQINELVSSDIFPDPA